MHRVALLLTLLTTRNDGALPPDQRGPDERCLTGEKTRNEPHREQKSWGTICCRSTYAFIQAAHAITEGAPRKSLEREKGRSAPKKASGRVGRHQGEGVGAHKKPEKVHTGLTETSLLHVHASQKQRERRRRHGRAGGPDCGGCPSKIATLQI